MTSEDYADCSKTVKQSREDFIKSVLSELAFKLNEKKKFVNKNIPFFRWAVPCSGFSYNNSLQEKVIESIKEKGIMKNPEKDIVFVLNDFDNHAVGVFFTTDAIYSNTPQNEKNKQFRVNFYNIKKLIYVKGKNSEYDKSTLEIITHSDKSYYITTDVFNKLNIKLYIQAAMGFTGFQNNEEIEYITDIKLDSLKGSTVGSIISGAIYGNASIANNMYRMGTFNSGKDGSAGHGYAAERMNTLYDILHGKDATLPGNNNIENGPDRLVDGVFLQSKYCATGQKCIDECFDKEGNFRYINKNDGTIMGIEVPSNKYDDAVKAMAEKIKEGKIPGHTNPDDAKDIVKKGEFSYEQACNVARAGNIDSLTYDAVNGLVICTSAFGVSAVITFACSIWNGDSINDALKESFCAGYKVAGVAFLNSIISLQLKRLPNVMALAQKISSGVIEKIGSKSAAVLVNALKTTGKDLYGAAAAKHLAKILKNNIVTGTVSVVVLSAGDISDIFLGRISAGQCLKNITSTATGIVGGYAGFSYGASGGASLGLMLGGPPGALVGGIAGALLGSAAGGYVAQTSAEGILSCFIDDDTKDIIPIIQKEIVKLAQLYILNAYEIQNVGDNFGADITATTIKDIYSSLNREEIIDKLLMKYIIIELEYRKKVSLPESKMANIMINALVKSNIQVV